MKIAPKSTPIKLIYILIICALSLISIHFIANYIFQKKISTLLNTDKNLTLNYDDINFSIYTGTIHLNRFHFIKKNNQNKKNIDIEGSKAIINGIGYFSLIKNNNITIEEFSLIDTKFNLHLPNDTVKKDQEEGVAKKMPHIKIETFKTTNVSFKVFKNEDTISNASIAAIDLQVQKIDFPKKTSKTPLPFTYNTISGKLSDIGLKVGKLEHLNINSINIDTNNLSFEDLKLESNYGKRELSKYLTSEKDYVSLNIPELMFSNWKIASVENQPVFTTDSVSISKANLLLFRDKAVKDNTKYESLYDEKLKKLPFKIDLPQIHVTDSKITYQQLVEDNTKAGEFFFDSVKCNLSISNLKEVEHQIKCKASALFMGKTPIDLQLKFTSPKNSKFVATGNFQNFDGSYINDFLETNLHTRIKGLTKNAHFEINGNNETATGKIKMKYENLELEILKQNTLKINNFLSTIGNFIINRNNKTDSNGFRYGKIEAERDQTKSFFNFLWLCIRSGIKDTITSKQSNINV